MAEKTRSIATTAVVALFLLSSVFVMFGINTTTADSVSSLPDAPTGLTATAGIYQISLSWTAPVSDGGSPIDYYVVYQEGVPLADHPVGTSIVITGLDLSSYDDGSYSFTVAAHNSVGIGDQSDPAHATPITTPPEPRRLTVTPGNGNVNVSWMEPDHYAGSPILYYIVYKDGVDVVHTTVWSFVFNGLVNGQTYVFSVASHNIAGNSTHTDMTAVPFTIPAAPTALTAIPGNGFVSLSWAAPKDGGSAITGYVVKQDGIVVNGTTGTSIKIDGLKNGQTYSFSIHAQNQAGDGPESSAIPATPRPDVTNVPSILTAVPGDGQVALSWSIPANNGGSAIDYYVVYQNGTDVKHFTGNSGNITGLTNGRSYTFTVAAHNAAGISSPSNSVTEIPFGAPNAPTGLKAIPGDGQVTLNWTAPAFDGGRDIDYYVIYQNGAALSYHLAGPTAVISGLVNDRPYSFTVSGHNPAGFGTQTAVVTIASSATASLPGAPSGVIASAGSNQVYLSWTAPASNGSSPVDYYVVYQDGVDVSHPAVNSTTISSLTNGQSYTFAVAAHNLAGPGPKSAAVSATPKSLSATTTVPDQPTGLNAVPGHGQVSLTWTAPVRDGGAAIDHYIVYQNRTAVQTATGTSLTITGLINGVSYEFRVAAHNSVGNGTQTVGVSATPYAEPTVPGVPNGLIVTPGDSKVTLVWSVPASNGGAAIDYYQVYVNGALRADHYSTTTATLTGLVNDQQYSFAVVAHNSVGAGAQSLTVTASPTTVLHVPGVPTGLTATPGNTQVTLTWNAPSNNGGAAIDSYIVYVDGTDVSHPSSTSETVTSLANGNPHNFTVAAHSSVGTGMQTSAVMATPGSVVPGAPTALILTPGNGLVKLTWTAPSNSAGIDYYAVYQNGIDVLHVAGNSTTVAGLTNGVTYSFDVVAHSAHGLGTPSTVQVVSPSASAASAAATDGNMDMIVYIGILAFLAVSIAVLLIVQRRRRGGA